MASWFRRVKAKFILALLFFLQVYRRIFGRQKKGINRFLSQYAADGVTATSAQERSQFPSYQRCIVCSLCTFSCAAIREGRAPGGFEPKYILLSLGRSSRESEFFLEEWLPCLECEACTVECPNEVPVHGMAEQIRERRNRVGFRS